MSSKTSGKQFSDRLLDPLEESMAKMLATDYVQKILMTGEMSDENIRYAQKNWKRSKDIVPKSTLDMMRRAYSLAVTETDRKILEPFVTTIAADLDKYYDRFERQLGGIGDDLKAQPMDAITVDYTIMHYQELKRGSILRMILTQMVGIWLIDKLHEYLKHEPRYRPNPLATNLLFLDFDPNAITTGFKSVIDRNGGHISAAEELELIQFAKELIDMEIKFHLNEDLLDDGTFFYTVKRFASPPESPINCVLFEDSLTGITGAVASALLTMMSVASLLVSWSQRLSHLYLYNGIFGLGAGAWINAKNVWTIELWQHRSAPVLQLSALMFGVGSILGPLIDDPYLIGHIKQLTVIDNTPIDGLTGAVDKRNHHKKKQQIVKNQRYFGEFRCHECSWRWSSGYCWLSFKQQCKKCGQWSQPINMRELDKSGLVKPGREPHQTDKCQKCRSLGYDCNQNKPGELVANKRYFGEFRCHKCHRHWYSAACWLGFKQQCNGCDQWSDPSNMRQLRPTDHPDDSHVPHRMDKCQKCQALGADCSRRD
ncbi:unnamed protein product [Medioppia subpectinata]|uniref:3CxxC-type domain-containing protein n=1 Tax=Medioppia subpectinata TaxID=1979941 RepID=A0A7R9KQE8_9ACAR|nr:unnamed protein product [Medioppia subpectinata]CAG2106501.1 unnamed protein product [Medioppia subpectinata]